MMEAMPQRHWTAAQVPSQAGRVAVVTGGNTGLGFQVARVLARAGARVIIASRDPDKAKHALAEIVTWVRRARLAGGQRDGGEVPVIETVRLDLASLASVREAADDLRSRLDRLDLLINNAGVMMTPFARTEDGFELQLGTNHLGPFAFTGLLISRMVHVPGARVVTVSSIVHRRGRIDVANLTSERGYSRSGAYGRSKLANLLFTYELQRRLTRAGAEAVALAAHPGYASTGLTRNLPAPMRAGSRAIEPFFSQTAEMGALPIIRAATDPGARGGEYYGPGGLTQAKGYPELVSSSARSRDEQLARGLWAESERLTGVIYPLTAPAGTP
jgi:NAD(P)-dependent dehydrogenase (short-subunit alcohol dehydrogenase family)